MSETNLQNKLQRSASSGKKLNLLYPGALYQGLGQGTTWHPPTDIYETEEALIVRVEVAGMRADDFAIELEGRRLMVSGSRRDQENKRAFFQMEIPFGTFALGFELPFSIAPDQVTANYQDGFLFVTLPKSRPMRISLNEQAAEEDKG